MSTTDSEFLLSNIAPLTRDFTFVGTNAYWLPYLNSDDDIRNTLANMSKTGITVVRAWGFNGANNEQLPFRTYSLLTFGQLDVYTIPDSSIYPRLIKDGNTADSGSWLQLIKDGNTTVNTGPNGIQRLDKVIKFAKEHNIFVYFSLTNNWFPTVNAPAGSCQLPRNYLSNNYG